MLRASRCESFTGADSLPAAAACHGLINKYTSYVNVLIGIGLPELSFSFSGTEAYRPCFPFVVVFVFIVVLCNVKQREMLVRLKWT